MGITVNQIDQKQDLVNEKVKLAEIIQDQAREKEG